MAAGLRAAFADGKERGVVCLAAEDRASPQTLSTIFLRSPKGEMIQLSNIVKVREAVAPKELKRFNQLRAVTLSADLGEGYALGDALTFLETTAREVLPETALTDVAGQSRESIWCWRRSSRASAIRSSS